jgi:hypothetical protein
MEIGYGPGASKEDVEEIAIKVEKKLIRVGVASTILGTVYFLAGTAIEILVKADFGYIIIAIGILGIGVGLTLWKS